MKTRTKANYKLKNIVEGSRQYKGMMKIIKKCFKENGIAELQQTGEKIMSIRRMKNGIRKTHKENVKIFSADIKWG